MRDGKSIIRPSRRPVALPADEIVEREYPTKAVHQGSIEPHAVTANMSEDGSATVWSSSQGQFMIRQYCAGLLEVPASNIRVIPAEIGGGFGGKLDASIQLPLAVAAPDF